jgi:Protein of unknown function (DUF2851)
MNEKLLQFIWQFQYFNKNALTTVDGIPLSVIHPGRFNKDQGPDFSEAKIKLDNTTWIGNVEIHNQSSQWHEHHHTNDPNYSNIILHVVWKNDEPLFDKNAQTIATLELQPLVSKMMLEQYEQLMNSRGFVPCEKNLPVLSNVGWLAWKERLAAERLQRKSELILQNLQQANNHWEEIFWWQLAKNFGAKVNGDTFEQMAKNISVNILAKHKNQINQLETLLFGVSGLLNKEFKEDYPSMLQREFKFLSNKYQLRQINKAPDFLRMRPANFPTIRLAQLAMLVFNSTHLFSKILEIDQLKNLYQLLNVTANDYWHYHYRFDEPGSYQPKNIGSSMTENIIINTIAPMLFAYGIYHQRQQWKDKALEYLTQLTPEKNAITNSWKQNGVANENALDSQALIELKNNYCDHKFCLQCAIGNKLLKCE